MQRELPSLYKEDSLRSNLQSYILVHDKDILRYPACGKLGSRPGRLPAIKVDLHSLLSLAILCVSMGTQVNTVLM